MRYAAAGLVLGIALAAGVPTAWVLTRPPATAGAPVAETLGTPSGSPAPSAPFVPAPTRDAMPSPDTTAPAPVRVVIPDLGVDAPVDQVGVRPDGQMAIPDDVDRVGWYRFGPPPGAPGSAVIAGHVDDREQGLGALAPLRGTAVGQHIVVTDAAGTQSRWRVVSRELISKQALPVREIFRRDGPPRLTLLTCGGPFLPEVGGYRDNVVVVAEPAA